MPLLFASWCGLISACGEGGGETSSAQAPAASIPSSPLPVLDPAPARSFQDVAAKSNIVFEVGYTDGALNKFTFGGAAAGDCDDDGDIDLFVTYGDDDGGRGPGGPNRLYRNLRDTGAVLQFEDIAAAANVANTRSDGAGNDRHSAPTFADINGDGHLDLFIGGIIGDSNKLYRGRGDCTFEDVTAGSGLERLVADHAISAAFGDYDLDGDLDLFLTHNPAPDDIYPPGESEHLFENMSDDSQFRFINVSAESGVTAILWQTRDYSTNSGDNTFTATFAEINGDDWPDIVIAADFGSSQLLLNAGDGTFVNGTTPNLRNAQYGMGSALGDIDFDGDLDWFITSISGTAARNVLDPRGNRLYRNDGGSFVDITADTGVADGGWGWGACFADLDNDTDLDLFHTNGWYDDAYGDDYRTDASVAFIAVENTQFSEQAESLGLAGRDSGRGVICADFDQDGDIDIFEFTNAESNSGHLWENRRAASGNNFLRVRLKGLPPNTKAAGARIYVTIDGKTQMREVTVGGNFTSQHPTEQHFGLGASPVADVVRVEWPARMPGPSRPENWSRRNVPASLVGEELLICHPGFAPVPADCTPSE